MVGGDGAVIGEVRVVSKLPLGFFRSRLVEHFDIKFKNGDIKWPARRGTSPVI